MKRPLKSRRVFGPVIDLNSSKDDVSVDDGRRFESREDLPESPMLEEYVDRMIEFTGQPEDAVINSDPVINYMKRLGVYNK